MIEISFCKIKFSKHGTIFSRPGLPQHFLVQSPVDHFFDIECRYIEDTSKIVCEWCFCMCLKLHEASHCEFDILSLITTFCIAAVGLF